MAVHTCPAATIIPPVFAGGGDELVSGLFIEHVAALHAPEGVLEGAEDGTDDVRLGIIVVQ